MIVTGTASGIGQALSTRFAEEGATVVCADFNEELGRESAAKIAADGGDVSFERLDVADHDACGALVAKVVADHGKLDVLANVAGILQFGHTTELSIDEWNRTIAVNLTGMFNMIKPSLPHLLTSGGNIVNVASSAGVQGQAYSAAYSASKGGVILLTKSLAVEYAGKGLRVNAVCPGSVDTPLVANMKFPDEIEGFLIARMELVRGKFAPPSDIAAVMCFLASDDAKHVNGVALPVDFGMTA